METVVMMKIIRDALTTRRMRQSHFRVASEIFLAT